MKKQYYLKISLLLMAFATLMLVAACEEETQDDYNLNSAPYCTIIEPISGSVYREADTISITVAVDDPDNDVSKVYFYVNDSAIDSLTKAPYTTAWPTEGAQLGSHQIKARAVDEKNYYDIYYISITLIERIYFGNGDGVTDIDGNSYPTVIIGEQEWMAENLKTTTYKDGTPIPVLTSSEWEDANYGALCWYNDDSITSLGALYKSYAVKTDKLCPDGWHVSTNEDWINMEVYLGMDSAQAQNYGWRGTNQGSQIAGRGDLWINSTLVRNAEFGIAGFMALPSGYISHRGGFHGSYGTYDDYVIFWVAPDLQNESCTKRFLYYREAGIFKAAQNTTGWGYSVRCVKD